MKTKKTFVKGSKKILNSWIAYDWANSVYLLVIVSTVFPLYYGSLFDDTQDYVIIMGYAMKNTALISFVTALSFTLLIILSPILSGIADYLGNKKTFMRFFVYLGSAGCVGLYWFTKENMMVGYVLYFIVNLCFWLSWSFYNSFLSDIAYPEQQDITSAKGFSFGYIGSVLLLLFNLSMIMMPEFYGIDNSDGQGATTAMKVSFVTVGIWWFLFSHYSLYYLPSFEKKGEQYQKIMWNGYKELKNVWGKVKKQPLILKYLKAFFIYSLALQTILLIAAYFGEQEINWTSTQEKTIGLIISILLIQLIGIVGALLTARISKIIGNIKTLKILTFIWAIICICVYFVYTPFGFYIAAACVGMVMGGIQALSRSTYSKIIPKGAMSTSYFSFYEVTEKTAIIIGMTMFGFIDQITGSMRNSVLFFATVFIISLFLLFRIKPKTIIS